MSLKKNISRLFQSLFGLAEFNDRDIRICLFISLIISLLFTLAGGFVEFQSDGVNLKWLLATIEHFSNALPFSILLSLTGLVIIDRIREVIIMRSDRVKEEIRSQAKREGRHEGRHEGRQEGRHEGRHEGRVEASNWYEQKLSEKGITLDETPPFIQQTKDNYETEKNQDD